MGIVIACAQFAASEGGRERNAARMAELAAEAARLRARILVLPELCLTGYLSPRDASLSAVDPRGPEMARVGEIARKTGVALCFGFAEKSAGGLYNSMALIERDGGVRAVYRKVHLWVTERGWAAEGTAWSASGWRAFAAACGSAMIRASPRRRGPSR